MALSPRDSENLQRIADALAPPPITVTHPKPGPLTWWDVIGTLAVIALGAFLFGFMVWFVSMGQALAWLYSPIFRWLMS
jgi:hypothetical protein